MRIVATILLIIIALFVLRAFVFDVYRVSGSSMEPTLMNGDYVFVSKASYGIRLPRSVMEVPVLNLFAAAFYSDEELTTEHYNVESYRHVPSNVKAKKGEVVIFNSPYYQRKFSVKRCFAGPGDSLRLSSQVKFTLSNSQTILPNSKGWIKVPRKKEIIGKASDYYYFLGDNPNFSTDSRTWGLVQKDHLVGKVKFVIFSIRPTAGTFSTIRWNRFFKTIS